MIKMATLTNEEIKKRNRPIPWGKATLSTHAIRKFAGDTYFDIAQKMKKIPRGAKYINHECDSENNQIVVYYQVEE